MPISGSSADRTLAPSAAFVELVCADADLLNAEFEAIVAAEWGSVPPDGPPARPPVPEPARERPPWALAAGEFPHAFPAEGEPEPMPARQRGPPARRRGHLGGGSR